MARTGKPRGRPPGVKNRARRHLLKLLDEKFPGYHPVVEMAKVANDATQPLEIRFAANKEVARYVAPVLAAVKVQAEVNENSGVLIIPSSPTSLEDWQAQAAAVNRNIERNVIEHATVVDDDA